MTQMEEKLKYFTDKLNEIRTLQREVQMKEGQFNDEFGPWMKAVLKTENFAILDVLRVAYEIGRGDK